ncbi:MAG: hypothetical protein Ct9H90mP27_1320 [Gammaproteobacteria bacterium]|nr:MAG: hypothetical protein Ct9H90mP27_1320 [Gammaproteobacteria bacterium]
MRGWYDVDPANPDGAIEDIEESADLIYQLIQAELDQGTPSKKSDRRRIFSGRGNRTAPWIVFESKA